MGTYPGWEVWSYILYKYTPVLTSVWDRRHFLPWL